MEAWAPVSTVTPICSCSPAERLAANLGPVLNQRRIDASTALAADAAPHPLQAATCLPPLPPKPQIVSQVEAVILLRCLLRALPALTDSLAWVETPLLRAVS